MKFGRAIMAGFAAVMMMMAAAAAAFADSDDAAWIRRCVSDNSGEGQPATVVAAYCSCMNDKMSSSDTLSITAWEKLHPQERKACSNEAGWK